MQDPVTMLKVKSSSVYYLVESIASFTITSERGSHLEYIVEYGDGDVENVKNPNMMSFQTPVIVYHKYTKAGQFKVKVTAKNSVSTALTEVTVFIEHSVMDTVLFVDEVIPFPFGNINILLKAKSSKYHYKDLFCRVEYGNGKMKEFTIDTLSYDNGKLETYQYFHEDIGMMTLEMACNNHVSTATHTKRIVLIEKIQNPTIKISKFVLHTFERLNGNITTDAGSLIAIEINYGDNYTEKFSIGNTKGGLYHMPFNHSYISPGHYTLMVNVTNTVSGVFAELDQNVIVQNFIDDTTVKIENIISTPPGILSAIVTYNQLHFPPSEVTCYMKFRGLTVTEIYLDQISNDQPLALYYTLPSQDLVGNFDIYVSCSNLIDSVNWTKVVYIQRKIDGLKLEVDRENVPVDDSAIFDVTVASGSNMTLLIDFGDGSSNTIQHDPVFSNPRSYTFLEAYPTSGTYTIQVKVHNLVSKATTFLRVNIIEPILGFQAWRYYIVSDATGEISYGEGDGNVFPKEREVHFGLSYQSGNLMTYKWQFGDGSVEETVRKTTKHQYQSVGKYTVTVTIWNPLYKSVINMTVEIFETVGMYKLENNGPKKAHSDVTLTLYLSRPGTKACYIWNMGDSSNLTIYGESHCKSMDVPEFFNYIPWIPSTQLSHTYMYRYEDTMRVNVTAVNFISEDVIYDTVIVRGLNCDYPEVNIIGDGRNPDEPTVSIRSAWITFESNAILHCDASNVARYNWTIQQVLAGKTYQDKLYKDFKAAQISTDKFQVAFPPLTFPVGQYVIQLTVSMALFPFISRFDLVYLHVDPSPLHVHIQGGNARPAGYNTPLTIDAASVSFDPDVYDKDNDPGLQFEWWCRQSHEEFTIIGQDIINPIILMPTVEERHNHSIDGCFGTGIGKMNITDGNFHINTLLLKPNSTNVFRVKVTKGERFGVFEQEVNIVEGVPPQIIIR